MDNLLKNKYDSIIFDLDGTLWDSSANVVVAWQTAKEQVDYIKEDFTRPMIHSITGMTYKAIFETLLPYLTEEQREEFKALAGKYELEILYENGGELYPGLEDALKQLSQRYKLFIVSNCQSGYIEVFFKISGFEQYFIGHQCYGTKNQPKAENIIDIVTDYELKAPVYVGDTLGDYTAATKAGVPFIFADYGFGKVEEGHAAKVSSLAELAGLL